jgi:hypothetical protein
MKRDKRGNWIFDGKAEGLNIMPCEDCLRETKGCEFHSDCVLSVKMGSGLKMFKRASP